MSEKKLSKDTQKLLIMLITTVLSIFGIDTVNGFVNPNEGFNAEEKKEMIENIESINERLDELVMLNYQSDIDILALGIRHLRTGEDVDNKVLEWKSLDYDAQLGAITRVSKYEPAKIKLRERLYSEEVFQTLMTYAK
jgi:hypothetical protein